MFAGASKERLQNALTQAVVVLALVLMTVVVKRAINRIDAIRERNERKRRLESRQQMMGGYLNMSDRDDRSSVRMNEEVPECGEYRERPM